MSRYRDPQLQVTENLCDLQILSPNIYHCFKIESIIYFQQMVIQVLVKTQNVYCSRHQCAKGYNVGPASEPPSDQRFFSWDCWAKGILSPGVLLVPQDVQRQTAVTAYLLLFAFELQSYDDWCPVISDLDYFGRQSMISDYDFGRCAVKSDGEFGRSAVNSDAAVNSNGDFGRCAMNSDAQLSSLLYH